MFIHLSLFCGKKQHVNKHSRPHAPHFENPLPPRWCVDELFLFFSVDGRRPGEEAQTSPRWILLHPDLADRLCPEEDAAHRPQHVHGGGPGAHLIGQDTLQSGKMVFWMLCHRTFCCKKKKYLFCLHRKTQTMKWRNTCVRTFIFRTRSVTVTAEAQSCFRQFICPFVRLCVAVGGPGRSVAVGPLQGRGGEERRTRRSRTHRGSDPEHLCSSFPPGAGDKSDKSVIVYSIDVVIYLKSTGSV